MPIQYWVMKQILLDTKEERISLNWPKMLLIKLSKAEVLDGIELMEIIPDIKNVKNLSARVSPKALAEAQNQQKQAEGEEILKRLTTSDNLVLLDENGKTFSSIGFSEFLQKKMNSGLKNLVFVIGGPYGFSDAIYARANGKVSLSAMTFSHQMVRLFVVEQLYRGFTILRNEPYHHR